MKKHLKNGNGLIWWPNLRNEYQTAISAAAKAAEYSNKSCQVIYGTVEHVQKNENIHEKKVCEVVVNGNEEINVINTDWKPETHYTESRKLELFQWNLWLKQRVEYPISIIKYHSPKILPRKLMWIKRKLLQSATTPETIVTIELSLPFKKKKKPLVFTIQSATTSESIETIPSTQKKDGSLEINEKITKELDVTSSNDLTTSAQNVAA
ncbi:hypothetical protein Glove_309g138 [Diversispora epigaea]|uniref:Uncharacterized protein n=1 Tax=Diversispora epigaea TaxID=1348612 RepID=A0A397HVN8_9GLOM|nr:hypothetical protein Glove_309g138 [Diversispora epigaea]